MEWEVFKSIFLLAEIAWIISVSGAYKDKATLPLEFHAHNLHKHRYISSNSPLLSTLLCCIQISPALGGWSDTPSLYPVTNRRA